MLAIAMANATARTPANMTDPNPAQATDFSGILRRGKREAIG
jgi:NAD dependent epimerase/dehydratase family enzyme